MITRKTILFYFLLLSLNGFSQDVEPTIFYNERLTLSPAMIGIEPCLTYYSTYRHQWPYIADAFKTFTANIEYQHEDKRMINPLGLGLGLTKSQEGVMGFNTVDVELGLAYTLPLKKKNLRDRVRIGASIAFYQKWIDWDKLVFSDHLDPTTGLLDINGNPNVSAVANMNRGARSRVHSSLSLALLYTKSSGKYGKSGDFNAGVTLHHVNKPHIDLIESDARDSHPLKISVFGSYRLLGEQDYKNGTQSNFYILPSFKISSQGFVDNYQNITTIIVGGYFVNTFNAKSTQYAPSLLYGPFYRFRKMNTDISSLALMVGTDMFLGETKMTLNYSYDITIGGDIFTDTGGAHEISLRLNFSKTLCNSTPYCPNKFF